MPHKFIQNIFTGTTGKKREKKSKTSFSLLQEQTQMFQKRKKSSLFFVPKQKLQFGGKGSKYKKLIFFSIFFLGLMMFTLLGPFFRVKTIYIFRQDNIININQAYSSIEYIRGENILFLNTNDIANRLQKSQKSIQNIEFEVHMPDTLNIRLKSHPAIFYNADFLILSNGAILKAENTSSLNIPNLLLSKDIQEFSLFGESMNTLALKNIQTLQERLLKNLAGFQLEKSMYFIIENELLISGLNGNIYIFDLSGNIEEQIEKLAIFQREQENITQKKYIYIDVRIPGKLFLCGYDEEYVCRRNLENIYSGEIFNQLVSPPQQ